MSEDAGSSSINTFGLMEDINDKLKILNYETKFCAKKSLKPLTPLYFALPGKASEQFPYFSQVACWLLTEIGASFLEWSEFDDPNKSSNDIMSEMKKLGFNAEFPVTKLRHGSGDAVCLALSFLLDKALAAANFSVQSPTYTKLEFAEEAAVDDDAEVEASSDIDEDVAEDESGAFNENDYFQPKIDRDEDEKRDMEMLEAKVDPAEWKLELERVGPRLKFKADGASKEWRTHIEQSQKHEGAITEAFPDAKVALDKIGKELRGAIDRIATKERNINKDFEHLGADFREKQKNLDEVQEQYNELSKTVAEYTQLLADKTDSFEMIKSQYQNQNNSITDNSPLRKIKTALTELRKEVGAMELRIGVVAQTLLQAKIKHQAQEHASAQAKAKNSANNKLSRHDHY